MVRVHWFHDREIRVMHERHRGCSRLREDVTDKLRGIFLR